MEGEARERAGGSGAPAAGAWPVTTPRPATSRRTSSGASVSIASRSESPTMAGITAGPGSRSPASATPGVTVAMTVRTRSRTPAVASAGAGPGSGRTIWTGAVSFGGACRYRSASRPMAAKMGAAASLPHCSFFGSSSMTSIAMRGSSAGAKPTKDSTPGARE